jgi:uncharacterized protein YjbJ (UPF0337 family)
LDFNKNGEGAIKDAAGKATGDKKFQTKGKFAKAKGSEISKTQRNKATNKT